MQQGDDDGDCIHAPCTCTYAVYMHVLTVCSEYASSLAGYNWRWGRPRDETIGTRLTTDSLVLIQII